jgi:hypothetical protein
MKDDKETITTQPEDNSGTSKYFTKRGVVIIALCLLCLPLMLTLFSFMGFLTATVIVLLLIPIALFFLSFALLPLLVILLLGGAMLGVKSCNPNLLDDESKINEPLNFDKSVEEI